MNLTIDTPNGAITIEGDPLELAEYAAGFAAAQANNQMTSDTPPVEEVAECSECSERCVSATNVPVGQSSPRARSAAVVVSRGVNLVRAYAGANNWGRNEDGGLLVWRDCDLVGEEAPGWVSVGLEAA